MADSTENEKETRRNLIDKQLGKAGWNVADRSQVIEELPISGFSQSAIEESASPYHANTEFSDYVLLGKDGLPLAVVEAKRASKNAEIGREQAKQYCCHIAEELKCDLPFCFYTNGLDIFFWDIGHYPPRKVVGFPTLDDLQRYRYIQRNRKPLSQELINTEIAGRDYQVRSIRAVLEGIEQKKRDFLLVMATGTGKTRISIAIVDAIMRAAYAEHILFLVDRISLREQALAAFKEYLPDEPRWPKVGEKLIAKDRRIYVSTYPTMLNIIRDEEHSLSPHFFDLVIVDESHRSIYNTYQEIIEYFKTITLGLTATPTDVIDHNTFQLFHCEDGLPTFAYTYEEAVNNEPPFLCNFQVMKIQTKFQVEGISKRTVSLEDQKQLILEGKDIEEINFEGTQLEKTITNKATNTLIVKEFMEECLKDMNGVLPGKTIFFCASIAHARRIERIFDKLFPQYAGELAKVMVSDDPRVYGKGGLLDQFANQNMPRIAISVDMLDTGIDVREIINLVFAKPVYSYTKFWQMIGRGTRLLEEKKLKPWCPEKDRFLIIDCWDNFEYFKITPKGKEPVAQLPLPVQLVGIRIDKIDKALNCGKHSIAANEIRKLRRQIDELPQNSIVILEAATVLHQVSADAFWKNLDSSKFDFLRLEIKPLFRTLSQVDFKAMRFERDLLEASLHLLGKELGDEESGKKFSQLSGRLINQITELPLASSLVQREETAIKTAQQEKFWKTCTDDDLNDLSERIAPLMKFREQDRGPGIIKTNFTDTIHHKEMVEFGPEHEAISITRYREMVEALILSLTRDNPVLQKIKQGHTITEAEAAELAELLHEEHPHITETLLRKVYQNRKARFIQFIRHILGIEILQSFPDTVSKAFDQFIAEHSDLNSRQLDFLNLLKNFIIDRETVAKRDLIQSPFTVIHPQGIRGIFSAREIDQILKLTEDLVA